jgi:hypothetical protein
LPVGVDVSGEGGVYGTPATRGTFTFRVGALDSADAQVFANKTLVVIDPPGPQPVLAEQALPPAFLGTFYSSELTATGGVPPYAWSAPGGLPPGLSLMPDGTLSGTPTEWAIWEFPLRVSDTGAQSAEQLAQLRVRTDTEYLDAMVTKCRITIPWRDYRAGLQADDTIRVKARFQVAPGLVLDQYARLTVYVAGVPFSFAPPRRAKWRKYATFNRKVNGVARGTAKLTWKNNKDRVTVKAVLRDAALAAALERYGAVPNGSGQVIVPVQVVLNEHSSGILQVPLQQSSTPNGKGKLKTQ